MGVNFSANQQNLRQLNVSIGSAGSASSAGAAENAGSTSAAGAANIGSAGSTITYEPAEKFAKTYAPKTTGSGSASSGSASSGSASSGSASSGSASSGSKQLLDLTLSEGNLTYQTYQWKNQWRTARFQVYEAEPRNQNEIDKCKNDFKQEKIQMVNELKALKGTYEKELEQANQKYENLLEKYGKTSDNRTEEQNIQVREIFQEIKALKNSIDECDKLINSISGLALDDL